MPEECKSKTKGGAGKKLEYCKCVYVQCNLENN